MPDPNQIEGLPPGATVTPLPAPATVQGLPPGATLAPIGAAAAPSPPPAPAPQPAQPAKPQSLMDRIGSFLGDTIAAKEANDPSFAATVGAVKGIGQTVSGAANLLNSDAGGANPQAADAYMKAHPGTDPSEAMRQTMRPGDPNGHIHAVKQAADWLKEKSQTHGIWEGLGSAGESIGEFLIPGLGEEAAAGDAAKVMSYGDKAAELAKNAKFLETPMGKRLAGLASIGARTVKAAVRSGAEAGTQTYVKTGGDTGEAGTAAAMGAAGGAVLSPLMEGAAGTAKAILGRLALPAQTADAVEQTAKDVIGERAAATNATRTVPTNALPASTGDFEFHIKGTPTEEVRGDQPLVQEARKKQIGTQVFAGKGPQGGGPLPYDAADLSPYGIGDATGRTDAPSAALGDPDAPGNFRAPKFQYLNELKPGSPGPATDSARGGGELITKDADVAAAHLASINKALNEGGLSEEGEKALTAQRDDIQDQIRNYYAHQKVNGPYKPNFPPVDAEMAMKSTPNLGEAAKAVKGWGKEVYDQANRVSGGDWQKLDKRIGDLQDKLSDLPDLPSLAEPRRQVHFDIAEAQNKMEGILSDPRNGFDATDIAQAKRNFRTGYILQRAHDALQPLYAMDGQAHGGVGLYRGVNGNQIARRWQAFMDAPENKGAQDIFGRDRVATLQRMFKANDTQASRRRFTRAVMDVGAYIGGPIAGHAAGIPGGAVTGEAVAIGARQLMHRMVVDPRVAKSLLFALDSGARPENYAPHIAELIARQGVSLGRRAVLPAAAGMAARGMGGEEQPKDEPQPQEEEGQP